MKHHEVQILELTTEGTELQKVEVESKEEEAVEVNRTKLNRKTVEIGLRMRALRRQARLSQKELGLRIGVMYQTLSNYERGFRHPSFEVIEKYVTYFDTTADYIISGIDPFSQEEKQILQDIHTLTVSELKNKFKLVDDKTGQEFTDEEIEKMLKYIKAERIMNMM